MFGLVGASALSGGSSTGIGGIGGGGSGGRRQSGGQIAVASTTLPPAPITHRANVVVMSARNIRLTVSPSGIQWINEAKRIGSKEGRACVDPRMVGSRQNRCQEQTA